MSWTYSQSTGALEHNGQSVGSGYSGTGPGRNNPDAQTMRNVGPIPRGRYTIGQPYADPHKGPVVMRLTPVNPNCLGRSEFLILGTHAAHDASNGCIILERSLRQQMAASPDHELEVDY